MYMCDAKSREAVLARVEPEHGETVEGGCGGESSKQTLVTSHRKWQWSVPVDSLLAQHHFSIGADTHVAAMC